MNNTNKGTFPKGHIPWNKGLSSKNDDRVLNSTTKSQNTKLNKYGNKYGKQNSTLTNDHKKKIGESNKISLKGKHLPKDKLLIKTTKQYLTRKKNNSFNTSNIEEEFYTQLLKENVNKTIYRQYKDDRYPFYCDFYIKEDDLFIEVNAHWTHGGKPYDENDPDCIKQLEEWKEKSKTSKFYQQAIDTWTIRDVNKQRIAKENNLNYKTIY